MWVGQVLASAIAGGATGVVLSESAGAGGGELYEAACRLRALLRGRAALLVVDRTDIVDAAEADGVLLSAKGALAACRARHESWGLKSGIACEFERT
jgi:thiamine monophosphate synthase